MPANDGTANTATAARIAGIDLVRALVMVVMVLDHTRDFVHEAGFASDPTDLARTTPALFFTRWITHWCAPVFVFLAGLSVRLQLQRGVPRDRLARATFGRGLFLVALELVVLRPLIWFNLDYSFLAHLQVIWAIGWALCALALVLRLPLAIAAALGAAIVAGHDLLPDPPFGFTPALSFDALRILLYGSSGILRFGDGGTTAFVNYALVPWFGVMLLGYACGALYALPAERRRRWLFALGLGATAAFVLLRALRLYGDPLAWSHTATGWRSVCSFLRVAKYPPSLQFVLMTLGPALLVLAAAERVRSDGRWRVLVALGRVPLFFYVLQWPAVHLASRLFQWLDGQPIGWDAPNPVRAPALPRDCGFSLPIVWLAWLLCLAVLVPLSTWFARWKTRHPEQRWARLF